MKPLITIAAIVWLEMLRRKDLYVLLILMAAFLIGMLALNIFGLGSVIGYVKEIGLLLLWICTWFLTVNLGARQLPREESTGTIFSLLAKPLKRGQLVAGKWLGVWGAGLVAGTVFHLLLLGVVWSRGGGFVPVVFLQHWLLHGCLLSILAATAILFSTRMNYDAAASLTYVATAGAYFLLPRVPELALHADGIQRDLLLLLYFALPHLDVFDLRLRLAHAWDPVSWPVMAMIIAYGAVVTALLLAAAWLAYRHKRFMRSGLI